MARTDRTQDTRTAVRRRARRYLGGLAALATLVLIAAGQPGAAAGSTVAPRAKATQVTARIRLGHFSPDTPPMDVYVTGFDGREERVLEGLGYGEVSDYNPLAPGNYSFALRPAGSPAESSPAVTASAELEPDGAYTFAALGPLAQLRKELLVDDLTPPPAGQAKVRLIQASASAPAVDVEAVNGPVIATAAAFAVTTDYSPVPAGHWTVRARTTDGSSDILRQLDLEAGTVNSLVVLEGTNGEAIELTRVVDATGVDVSGGGGIRSAEALPVGGVGTGAGGTSGAGNLIPDDAPENASDLPMIALVLLLTTAVALGSGRLLSRRSA